MIEVPGGLGNPGSSSGKAGDNVMGLLHPDAARELLLAQREGTNEDAMWASVHEGGVEVEGELFFVKKQRIMADEPSEPEPSASETAPSSAAAAPAPASAQHSSPCQAYQLAKQKRSGLGAR